MSDGEDPKKAYSEAQLREALRLLPENASKEEFAAAVAKAKRNEELIGSMGATILQAKKLGKTTFVFDLYGVHEFPRIEIKNVQQSRDYLYGNVKAWMLDTNGRVRGFTDRPLVVRPRINFTSQRGLDDLAKSLRIVDDRDWSIPVAEIASILVDAMENSGEHTVIQQLGEQSRGWNYLLQGFVPAETVSCIMAHGGHGKTMTADLTAVALASGTVLGPFKPLVKGPVLIVDYEQRWQFHAARISRICDAIGIEVPDNIHHFKPSTRIMDCLQEIVEIVEKEGVVWTVVDSIAFAAGGDINSPEAGITATNALKEIPGAVTFLAHVSRADREPQRGKGPPRESAPIGSSFFWNGATVIYELKETAQQSLEDSKNYVLMNPKANVGTKWRKPMGWSLKFDDPGGPISVAAEVVTGDRPGGESLPMPTRIQDYLKHRGRASAKEVALGLGMMGPGGVKRAAELLAQMHGRGVLYKWGEGPDAQYALLAKELEPPAKVDPDAPKCRCGEPVAAYGPEGEPLCARHGSEQVAG